jgi:hypothetical protein
LESELLDSTELDPTGHPHRHSYRKPLVFMVVVPSIERVKMPAYLFKGLKQQTINRPAYFILYGFQSPSEDMESKNVPGEQ